MIRQAANRQQGSAHLHLPISTAHLEPYLSPLQNLPCSKATPSLLLPSLPLAPLPVFHRALDCCCPQLSGQGGKSPFVIFICHQLLRFPFRVFPTPCLGCLWGKMLGKAQLSTWQPLRKQARQNRKQKEAEKSLDFMRRESRKRHKTKSMTFI